MLSDPASPPSASSPPLVLSPLSASASSNVNRSSPNPSSPANQSAPDAGSNDSSTPDAASIIDLEIFRQILDLDEDDSHDFSKGMAWAYFLQAAQTFKEMDEALAAKDLAKLSSLGHFLKGSSAALGVAKVQASCERMQNLGQRRDEEAGRDLSDEEAFAKIRPLLVTVKEEYAAAAAWLKTWYKLEDDT